MAVETVTVDLSLATKGGRKLGKLTKGDQGSPSFLKLLSFIYSHAHTLFGSFLPPAPHFHPLPPTPSITNNKKDKALLLVEIRIVIQRDS
jgi:hypothetical protein